MITLIGRFYADLWNQWNDDAISDVLHSEFVFRGSLGAETVGVPAWRGYRALIRAGAADFHNEVEELVADEGGRKAAARLRYSGTHTGALLGIPATHRRFEYAGAAFFESDGERLTRAWVLGDLESLRRQLSAP